MISDGDNGVGKHKVRRYFSHASTGFLLLGGAAMQWLGFGTARVSGVRRLRTRGVTSVLLLRVLQRRAFGLYRSVPLGLRFRLSGLFPFGEIEGATLGLVLGRKMAKAGGPRAADGILNVIKIKVWDGDTSNSFFKHALIN